MNNLENTIMAAAFADELEKIAAAQELGEFEKVAHDYFTDWDELEEFEKVAVMKALKQFGSSMVEGAKKLVGKGGAASQVAKRVKAKPLVSFGDKPLAGTAALKTNKYQPGVGSYTRT